jgi:hypothetical protein
MCMAILMGLFNRHIIVQERWLQKHIPTQYLDNWKWVERDGSRNKKCFYVWRHGFGPLHLHLTLELLGPRTILLRTFRMFQYVNLNSGNTLHTSYWLKTKYDQKQFTSIMRSFAFRTSWFALSVINSDVVSPVKATSGNLIVSVIYIPSQELILVQILSYRAIADANHGVLQ